MTRRPGSAGASVPPSAVVDRDEAVAVLFHRHSRELVGVAFCLLGDRGVAEEVVQDAFVALHRHWRELREQPAAVAYLRAAVERMSVTAAAAGSSTEGAACVATGDDSSAQLGRDGGEPGRGRRMAAAVRALPARQREVLVCRFYLELTETQTATVLEIGRTSVKTHERRGLAGLIRRLEVTP